MKKKGPVKKGKVQVKMKHFSSIKLFFSGILIGLANLIPGVSGGTIAVVLGIYDELITALSECIPNPVKSRDSFILLFLVGCGAIAGIYFFSGLIDTLLTTYTFPTLFFFMGLIVGSVPVVYRSHKKMEPSFIRLSIFCLFFFSMVTLAWQSPLHLSETTPSIFRLILSGIFAAGSMIVPGISGSFILLLMGTYKPILNAVHNGDGMILLWVILGAVLGIVGVSKGIAKILKRYPAMTQYAILGLLVGSIVPLFPSINGQPLIVVVQGGLSFIAGTILVSRLG